jgi:hypothetical protein
MRRKDSRGDAILSFFVLPPNTGSRRDNEIISINGNPFFLLIVSIEKVLSTPKTHP